METINDEVVNDLTYTNEDVIYRDSDGERVWDLARVDFHSDKGVVSLWKETGEFVIDGEGEVTVDDFEIMMDYQEEEWGMDYLLEDIENKTNHYIDLIDRGVVENPDPELLKAYKLTIEPPKIEQKPKLKKSFAPRL